MDGDEAQSRSARPRETPFPAEAPRAVAPTALAISERARADFWKLVGLGTAMLSLMLALLTIRAGRSSERVYVMDPVGNLVAGPLEVMADSKGFFHMTALYAANTALQRSTEGFDLYELLPLYFMPRAVQKLEDDWERSKDDVQQRNLQQKPLIESIGEPVVAGERRLVEVRGRVVSAGAYASRSFYEERPFRLVLTLRKNPDLAKVGAYPWVCEDFDLAVEETKS